jgi:hypothetical protein
MRNTLALAAAPFALILACSSDSPRVDDAGTSSPPPPWTDGEAPPAAARVVRVRPEVVARSEADGEVMRRITAKLDEVKSLSAEEFAARYPISFVTTLGYDPTTASNMDRIQASSLRLNDGELVMLKERGFVITDRNRFPNFTYGYRAIYAEHLPLYVSADSILEGVHRSYDDILASLEQMALAPAVSSLLDGAYGALAALPSDETRRDLDLYLSVARSLLANAKKPPTLGGDAALFDAIMAAASSASGVVRLSLFGSPRDEDFSQYVPRGHYTDPFLAPYFKAMMWLGRTDFRFLETQSDGSQVLRRRHVMAAFALRELLDSARMQTYRSVDDTIRFFVGDQDYLTVDQLPAVAGMLGIADHSDLARLSDDELAAGLGRVSLGSQRIASHIMQNGTESATLPLSLSFAFFGQRYVVDSHVFSLVVYDRVPGRPGVPLRMMPKTFDVAFAALANDHAGALLASELATYRYAPFLASARILADEHGSAYWQSNLYNLWLSALRGLSPSSDLASSDATGLFTVARTEPWSRRLLNTQLASWSELRHDTILYAKQSYTGVPVCEFPDAYVDPYPKFYAAIEALAARGREMIARVPFLLSNHGAVFETYFTRLGSAVGMLRQMAEAELVGAQFTAAQLEFINQAVALRSGVCTAQPVGATGWYPALYWADSRAIQRDPVIADVHTQPADEGGNPVGKVLHVATGDPRQMVVTTDTCGGPRAYVGLASSHFERVTEGFARLTDEQWATSISGGNPPDLPWMADVVAR